MVTRSTKGEGMRVRPFASFLVFASFGILAATGLLMYLWPSLQVRSVLGFDRGAWNAMHTTVSFVSIAAAGLHIVLNWSTLIRYLKRGSAGCSARWRECGLAALLMAIVVAGTLLNVPPFSSIAPRKHHGGPPPGVRLELEGGRGTIEAVE